MELKTAHDFKYEKFRDFSKKNTEKFLKDKALIFYEIFKPDNQSNQNINNVFKVFNRVMKNYFPKRKKQKTYKRLRAPWLTNDIMRCIKNKHTFFKLYKCGKLSWSFFQNIAN